MSDHDRLTSMLSELIDQRDAWEGRGNELTPPGHEINIRDWVRVTGIGLGIYGQYRVATDGVFFKGWTPTQIEEAPVWQQPQMLAENEHRLVFPCTPRQLLNFVRNDVSGCLGTLEESIEAHVNTPLSLEQQRTAEILMVCKSLNYNPLSIIFGGKTAIKNICLKKANLFTKATFDKAWKAATGAGHVRMADSDKYAGRGK